MEQSDDALVRERINNLWEKTDFSATLFQTLVGYAVVAADFDGTIIAFNEGARQIYGYRPDEVVGKSNIEILFPHDFIEAGYFQQLVDVLLATGRFSYEGEKVRKNGARFPAEILFTLTKDKTGIVVGLVEIVYDLSERKRAEEELQRTATDLLRSNKELEQFAYVASHDLKEPLRKIRIYLEMLAQRYQGRLDEQADQFITHAVQSAGRMQTLVNDLLAYARVGSSAKQLEPVSCTEAYEQALANLEADVQEAEAQVSLDTPLPTVAGKLTQLTALFQNLLGNALKFRGANKPVVHIAAKRHKDEWVFSVRDNGIGIDPQYLERIFVIFERLHSRAEYPGTGIGLAICKKIAELHGGRIWVESESGKGSTFFFSLPAQKDAPR